MSHSSPHRGQLHPLAALIAVIAVTTVLGLYAGVFADTIPNTPVRSPAPETLTRIVATTSTGGVLTPASLTPATIAGVTPPTLSVNVTLRTADQAWYVGPRPPRPAATAAIPVPVRTDTAIVPGRLRVVVWR
ncbi:MAG: hypothetical protein ABEJ57_00140 [Halobacteriaceae archaeon]